MTGMSLCINLIEMLISDFIVDETRHGLQTTDASCGEVHLEIDAYTHPATGELDGNLRGRDMLTPVLYMHGYKHVLYIHGYKHCCTCMDISTCCTCMDISTCCTCMDISTCFTCMDISTCFTCMDISTCCTCMDISTCCTCMDYKHVLYMHGYKHVLYSTCTDISNACKGISMVTGRCLFVI